MIERDRCKIEQRDCFTVTGLQADLILLDPPFEICDQEFVEKTNQMALDNARPGTVVVWFSKQPHSGRIQAWTETETDMWLLSEYIWHWDDTANYRSERMPLLHHETIYVFVAPGAEPAVHLDRIREDIGKPSSRKRVYKSGKTRKKDSKPIYWYPKDKRMVSSVIHMQRSFTQWMLEWRGPRPIGIKPVNLMRLFVEAYADNDALVYDPFAGSGAAGLACQIVGDRQYYGTEIDGAHFSLLKERLFSQPLLL